MSSVQYRRVNPRVLGARPNAQADTPSLLEDLDDGIQQLDAGVSDPLDTVAQLGRGFQNGWRVPSEATTANNRWGYTDASIAILGGVAALSGLVSEARESRPFYMGRDRSSVRKFRAQKGFRLGEFFTGMAASAVGAAAAIKEGLGMSRYAATGDEAFQSSSAIRLEGAAAGLGVALGAANTARFAHRAHKAKHVVQRLSRYLPRRGAAPNARSARYGDLTDIARYARTKQRRRVTNSRIQAVTSAVSTAGNGMIMAGALGATMLTPVGWALAGAASLVGVGMLAKRVWRWRKARNRQQAAGAEAPAGGKRAVVAGRLLQSYLRGTPESAKLIADLGLPKLELGQLPEVRNDRAKFEAYRRKVMKKLHSW